MTAATDQEKNNSKCNVFIHTRNYAQKQNTFNAKEVLELSLNSKV
jgi:hypothetical protein